MSAAHRTAARPRLALVLGSGGVRMVAALGVAEVLASEGLQPDLLVGCSAGALFGALIAMGHAPADAQQLACRVWHADITRQRRWRAVPQMLFPRLGRFDADFALRDDAPVMRALEEVFGDTRLEHLPVALRVAATAADTGAPVVLRRGRLVDVLRASIALPFMFSPVMLEGRRLVDGFLSDPLPVAAAADAQTLLSLHFTAPMPRRIDGPSRLLAQVTSAMINNLTEARLAAARCPGQRHLAITPPLTRRVGLFDTAAMPQLVQLGRHAAAAALPEIRALQQQGPALAAA